MLQYLYINNFNFMSLDTTPVPGDVEPQIPTNVDPEWEANMEKERVNDLSIFSHDSSKPIVDYLKSISIEDYSHITIVFDGASVAFPVLDSVPQDKVKDVVELLRQIPAAKDSVEKTDSLVAGIYGLAQGE